VGRLGKTFRLRLGAKSLIALGAIGMAAGLLLIANALFVVQRMNAATLTLARPYGVTIVTVLGAFFLLLGMSRIWAGLRAREKRWFSDPLEREDGTRK
jgi:uncharacterized membrane protein HdeD (DUF308 family)